MPYVRKVCWETKTAGSWLWLRDHTQYQHVAYNLGQDEKVLKFWNEDKWIDKDIDWEGKPVKIYL